MNNIFSIRLKEIRKKRKITQEQLAKLTEEKLQKGTKYRQTSISRYENNLIKPGLDEIIALSKALNVTSDYLLGLTNEDKKLK